MPNSLLYINIHVHQQHIPVFVFI